MTPDVFAGLWRRRSVAVDGAAPGEPATVHWIQWGDRFLDLREPDARTGALLLSGPGVFGGTTTWSEPVLTWHHEIDSHAGGGADAGDVSWDDGALVERGSFELDGRTVNYVEVWERVTPPGPVDGRSWVPCPDALAVEVDGHRIAAILHGDGRWLGAMSEREPDGRWALRRQVGDGALLGVLRGALLGAG